MTRRFSVVLRTDLPAETRALLDWIQSPAGQEASRAAGSLPVDAGR